MRVYKTTSEAAVFKYIFETETSYVSFDTISEFLERKWRFKESDVTVSSLSYYKLLKVYKDYFDFVSNFEEDFAEDFI